MLSTRLGALALAAIGLAGPPVMLPSNFVVSLSLMVHELATNAAKYGALSTPEGKVHISWDTSSASDGTSMCHLTWKESGGPPVERPSRRGFGACTT